jgi:hypothetical protein
LAQSHSENMNKMNVTARVLSEAALQRCISSQAFAVGGRECVLSGMSLGSIHPALASNPHDMPSGEIRRLLTFAFVGAGTVGVEMARWPKYPTFL